MGICAHLELGLMWRRFLSRTLECVRAKDAHLFEPGPHRYYQDNIKWGESTLTQTTPKTP